MNLGQNIPDIQNQQNNKFKRISKDNLYWYS